MDMDKDEYQFINEECTDVSIEEEWLKNFATWLKDNLDEDEIVLEVCAGNGILSNELKKMVLRLK